MLIATKFAMPLLPPHTIERPQLQQRLQQALQRGQRLVLLSAPAGFGKSTLVSGWLTQHPHPPVAWLSLDADDNYPELFLQYLLTAITNALPTATVPTFVASWQELTDSTVRLMLAPLVNALVYHALPLVIVLDDYHEISNQLVHTIVTFLLKYLPPCVQFVIASRTDPPLPLASLRAQQQLAEIRMADLRFNPHEMRSFFVERWSVPLAEDVLQTIGDRTEGWAVGLQLAALMLSEQSPAGVQTVLRAFDETNSFMLDYLAEEVFQHLPATTQLFLLRTSILDRLNDELCQTLMEDVPDAPRLSDILRLNLFLIQLGEQRWYRYHHLFAQFLRARLSHTFPPEVVTDLHVRASTWLMHHGLRYEALHHVIEAKAWDAVLRLLTPAPSLEEISPNIHIWRRWIGAIPDAVLATRSDLYLIKLWGEVLGGDITVAEKGLARSDMVFPEESQGSLHLIRQHLALFRGQHAQHIYEGTRALALLSPDKEPLQWAMGAVSLGAAQRFYHSMHSSSLLIERAWQIALSLNEPMVMLLSAGKLAETAFFSGKPRAATSWLNQVRHLATNGYTVGVPFWCRVAARVAYEHNDLAQAEHVAKQGLDLVQLTSRFHNAPTLYLILARTYEASQNADDATIDSLLEQGYKLAHQYNRTRERLEIQVGQLRRWLAHGDLPRAQHWCAAHPLDAQTPLDFDNYWLVVAHVYVARAMLREHGDDAQATAVEPALAINLIATSEAGRMDDHIHLLLLHALLLGELGRADEAAASLRHALVLGEPEGYLRTFLDEGPDLLPLLEHPAVVETAPVLASQLRALLAPHVAALPEAAPQSELLSVREREILRLIADGLTVHDIATQLVISVHTARTHLKHIYAKLDVHTRIQAIAYARARGLL